MELIIGSDVVPTSSNKALFHEANVMNLLGKDIFDLWNRADMRIFNLETPLVDEEAPIDKCGPNFITPTGTINGIKGLNPTLLTLANNHIMDQGTQGLASTRKLLFQYDIPNVGTGKDLYEAQKPYILKKGDLKIGVYACAEHEFSISTKEKAGANPFDPLESLDHIIELKEKCDYLIVLYHGGKEHYRYPSPYLQKACRKMAQKGADIIICQHSHCIGSYEDYEDSKIIYGQGNFLFDKYDNEFWNTGLLIKLNIEDGINVEYIPFTKESSGIRLATGNARENILSGFEKRSANILKEGFIEEEYQRYAKKNIYSYLRKTAGMNKWIARLDKYILKGKLVKFKYKRENLLKLQNTVECEAHRELLISALNLERKNY
ncbi:CapA family protein [Marinococcus halophilus]|uniref:CapA family protein n=1 Tax=Marinococcus halophilus TaxID=1371 RepID=UPI0009A6438C|nr:CapA family protein [Marinococcus halophilus]